MNKIEIWNLLKWLKANHYLPQTEMALQEIVEYYTDWQVTNKFIKADVIKSVCDHEWRTLKDENEIEYHACKKCWAVMEQTVL